MAKKAKVSYDEENDILWVHSEERVRDSLEIDSFVIDFSHDDKVVGIEIFNASEVISNLSMLEIGKESLSGMKEAAISSYQSKELFYVVIRLALTIKNKLVQVSIQIPAPKVAIAAV